MKYLKNKRILAIVGLICLILGVVLPYYSFDAFLFKTTIRLWDYLQGKLIILLILVDALFIFMDYIEKFIPKLFKSNFGQKIVNLTNPKISLIPLVLIVIFVIYLNSKISYLDKDIGFYILWVGVVLMIGHAFIYKWKKDSNSQTVTNVVPQMQNDLLEQNNQNQINIGASNPQVNVAQYNQPIGISNPQANVVQNNQPMGISNPQVANSVKYCPQCGTVNDINSSVCPNCMFKF